MKKRILTLLLALALILSLLPAAPAAAQEDVKKDLWASIASIEEQTELCKSPDTLQARAAAFAENADAVCAVVEASPAYVPGSLIRNGSFLSWRTTDGIVNIWSPMSRARLWSIRPEECENHDVKASVPDASQGTYSDCAVFQPFYDIDRNFTEAYRFEGESYAEKLGGEPYRWTGTTCTIGRIAEAMTRFGVVLLDSHGDSDYYDPNTGDTTTYCNVNYLCLTSGTGITSRDMTYASGPYGSYPHAGLIGYISGTNIEVWDVDGTAIANHMKRSAPNNLVWNGICMGMTTDTIEKPLREKGVGVIVGYSKSVTFAADESWLHAFTQKMVAGKPVKDAIYYMRQNVGVYDPYSSEKAYPIVVSEQDAYPGRAYVNQKQSVNSTWTLSDIGWGMKPPVITKQPSNASAPVGQTVTIGVTVEGQSLSYQWEYCERGKSNWQTWEGHTSASFTVAVSESNNGCRYRCRINNPAGRIVSKEVRILAEDLPPVIVEHPHSYDLSMNYSVEMSVSAVGVGLQYQWQYLKAGDKDWRVLTGKTSSSITVRASATNDGCKYRCIVSNPAGSTTSNEARIRIMFYSDPPSVVKQPVSRTAALGKTVTFEVGGSGKEPSYQWEYSKAGETAWHTFSGQTWTTLTVTVSKTNNGCRYRCLLSNSYGTAVSDAATLLASDLPPTLLQNPASVSIAVGEQTTFRVKAVGAEPKYQWQYRKAGDTVWRTWSGKTAAEVSVTASATNNGCQYRCVVSNSAGSVTSEAAMLNVSGQAPVVVEQPQSATLEIGGTMTLRILAAGTGLTYQWQYRKAGETVWRTWSGKTAAEVSVTASATNNGCQYRCVVSNSVGTVTSESALLHVSGVIPVLLEQPESASVEVSEKADFRVAAAGGGLTYQWQYLKAGETNWRTWSGKTGPEVSVTASATNNGCQYRCVVSNSVGSVTSEAAVLQVTGLVEQPVFVTQPKSASAAGGESMTFFAAASGGGAMTYQWQILLPGEESWTDLSGETSTYYSVVASAEYNGCSYRCAAANEIGTAYSEAAVLTVTDEHECPGADFTDLPDWGTTEHAAIDWAVRTGITTGATATTFAPDATVTRGQAVTFLWRACGSPEPETTKNPFTDVKESSYCCKAVLWANENNITNGTTSTTFAPNKICSRGQILTFLYRQQGSPEVDESATVPYTDIKDGAYYEDAMKWAYANGIDKGVSETAFSPNADCTRVAVVVFLYRAITGQGRLE